MMDKNREQVLENFFKEFFTWKADNIGYWIVAGIMETISAIYMFIPYQNISRKPAWILLAVIAMTGVVYYINPYIYYQNEGKRESIYEVIKFLPVSRRELRIFRLKKVVLFCLKLFPIFLGGQIISALVCFGSIGWENLLYPFVFGLVTPLLLAGSSLWAVK